MIRMVVFDMAGTTVNEDNVVYKMVQKAINEQGFNVTLEQVLAQGAGKEKLQAIKSVLSTYLNNIDDALADEIYQRFVVLLEDAYNTAEILPNGNAEKLFEELHDRDILVVLNTGYNSQTARWLLQKLGWEEGGQYDYLVTASDVEHNRPGPDMIQFAMQEFDLSDAAEVIKVGDSIIDIEEGKNAGCKLSIGITTGAHTRVQLKTANPDYIIDDLLELLPLLD